MEAQVAALLLAVLWFRTSHLTFLSLSFLDCKVGQISAQFWGRNQWHNVHENDSHHVEYLTIFLYVTKVKLHRPQIVNSGSRPLWSIKCLPVLSILYIWSVWASALRLNVCWLQTTWSNTCSVWKFEESLRVSYHLTLGPTWHNAAFLQRRWWACPLILLNSSCY